MKRITILFYFIFYHFCGFAQQVNYQITYTVNHDSSALDFFVSIKNENIPTQLLHCDSNLYEKSEIERVLYLFRSFFNYANDSIIYAPKSELLDTLVWQHFNLSLFFPKREELFYRYNCHNTPAIIKVLTYSQSEFCSIEYPSLNSVLRYCSSCVDSIVDEVLRSCNLSTKSIIELNFSRWLATGQVHENFNYISEFPTNLRNDLYNITSDIDKIEEFLTQKNIPKSFW